MTVRARQSALGKPSVDAAEQAEPGDVVVIRGGIYRERVIVKSSGTAEMPIRFETAPGEQVVVTGADVLAGWRKADAAQPVYSVAWPHRFITWNQSMTHPNDAYHRLIGRCEQVGWTAICSARSLTPLNSRRDLSSSMGQTKPCSCGT